MANRKCFRNKVTRVGLVKLERGCMDCGYDKHPAALQFDHRPGEIKLGNVSQMFSKAWDVIEAEIAKCDVVCANCHAVRTAERRRATQLPNGGLVA